MNDDNSEIGELDDNKELDLSEIDLNKDMVIIKDTNLLLSNLRDIFSNLDNSVKDFLKINDLIRNRLLFLTDKNAYQDEIIGFFDNMFAYCVFIQETINKSSDTLESDISEILKEYAEIYIKKRHVKNLRKQVQLELDNLREEEEILRGKTRIEKCLILSKELKDYIDIINHLEKELIAEGDNVENYNSLQKEFIREFGDYEFSLFNAKICQSKVNQILKHLIILISNKTKDGDITQFEKRSFLRARGILKTIHYRINWLLGDSFETEDSNPIEILRIFSTLEPTLTNLSALEEDTLTIDDYDKIMASFKNLLDEEKIEFMKVHFKDNFIEKLDGTIQKNVFIRLLAKISLNPNQLIDQMGKWDRINKEHRKKFLGFLRTELTEKEKLDLAHDEIEQLKSTWG